MTAYFIFVESLPADLRGSESGRVFWNALRLLGNGMDDLDKQLEEKEGLFNSWGN
jgi:hypothetical protein